MAGGEEPLNRELYRIPGHAGWFSWNAIHSIEREALPEFFEGRTMSKTPKIYKEYRDFMINKYRECRRPISFTEIRKMLVGDVNCLSRVYDFLQHWGLINYVEEVPSLAPAVVASSTPAGMFMSQPKSFASTPAANLGSRDSVLQPKLSQVKDSEWSTQEIMQLLEAVSKYGENWDKVAQHVGSKSKMQCVKQFVLLPFGDQFLAEDLASPVSRCLENGVAADANKPAAKKQKISNAENMKGKLVQQTEPQLEEVTPLNDSSNPLLAQVAFMAAMVGPRVAAAAAQAALNVIAEEDPAVSQLDLTVNSEAEPAAPTTTKSENDESDAKETGAEEKARDQEPAEQTENGQEKQAEHLSAAKIRAGVATALAAASVNAKALAEQEERQIELVVSELIETQLRKLQSKLEHFEELEHLMEKERLQLEQMREQVFIDRILLKRQQFAAAAASKGVIPPASLNTASNL